MIDVVYTVCELDNIGAIELAQMPGYAIYVRGTLKGLDKNIELTAKVHERGRLGT